MADAVDETGIPLRSPYDNAPVPPSVFIPIYTIFVMGVGQGLAWPIYLYRTAGPDEKVKILALNGLGWIYVGAVLIKLLFDLGLGGVLNEARKASRVNLPDQHVYRVYTKRGAPPLGYVTMEKEGALGQFNRAQRAYQNFLETAPFVIVYFLLAGFVFPFPLFCIALIYSAARILSAVGYVSAAGARINGTMFATLALSAMEALVLLAGVKAIYLE